MLGLLDVSLVAAAGALEGGFERWEQKDGEVGLEVVARGAVHGQNALAAEPTSAALIGFGGVGVAVAEDDLAVVERGQDDPGDRLGAVGEHQGHLGGGSDGAVSGFGS